MTPPLHLLATGARTPLGLQSATSAASFRAGINGVKEHPFMIDRLGQPMPGALDLGLDPELPATERLIALAASAMIEACSPLVDTAPSHQFTMPVYVGLPEPRPGFTPADVDRVRSALARTSGLPLQVSSVHASTTGHASGISLLAYASEQMNQGAFDICLVGGVDSYFNPDTMEWLDANRQLAGGDARSAFVPGEGAGFCLLMTERLVHRLGLQSFARVVSAAMGKEESRIKTTDVCLGLGLTAVVRKAVTDAAAGPGAISSVICDLNGERYRGEEWGFVCLRLSQFFDDPTGYWSPADSWGDVGAASGPLFAMLACQAAVRGYGKGPLTLLWASSEGGLRAAAVLDTATQ